MSRGDGFELQLMRKEKEDKNVVGRSIEEKGVICVCAYVCVCVCVCGGSSRNAPTTRSKFFHFHAVFCKKFAK